MRSTLGLALAMLVALSVFAGGAHAAEAQLPNLVADAPDSIGLETSTTEGGLKKSEPELLLRFNGYIHNVGPGAVDFRGTRTAPKLSAEVAKRVKEGEEKKEELPESIEQELAAAPMTARQRLFTTAVGQEETNIERAHVDEASSAQLIYSSADGHHHWHLQHAAKYSLWNAAKTAEVAPAQKAGFCLDDSQHVETSKGPSTPVYADNVAPFRDFCQQFKPNATTLFEGISPGWRDLYSRELAFQWVNASNVLPGEYWLREEVNAEGIVKETGGANTPVYAGSPTIIPGFDALAQLLNTQSGEARTITLTSKAYSDANTPTYKIVSAPAHGALGAISKNQVTYTPTAGYTGPDSFTFESYDAASPFPHSPAVATVSIEVGAATGKGLLAGDATASYAVGDQTTAGREEAFQFTAKSSGTVEELQFRTDGVANSGVSGLVLGILAENAGKPGEVLAAGTASGEPATNSWIKVGGLSRALLAGTKYWLVALPLGPSSAKLHYDAAVGSGGTGNVESTTGGLGAMTAESAWETFNQGPVGFQAIGSTGVAEPSVTIEGAPASMTAGTSVQLTAHVLNDSPTVTWGASAGSITAGGLYTAPAEPPAGGSVTITATSAKGAKAQVTIQVTKVAEASVTIEGAPASMTVGTSVQLTAHVLNDSPTVTWGASAGSITTGGLYTAPSEPPAGGSVTITATSAKGAKAQVTIQVKALEPSVTIEGAPASMTVGTSVQLTAHVLNDSPTVTWGASAGSITTGGLYTAPAEPPAGGKVTVTATTAKGAKAQVTIEIVAVVTKGLLAGDATSSYAVGDQTTAGREEAFQFTAKSSGTVEELLFRTDGVANTGVTGLVLGILAENAGKPGEVLAAGTASGTPATNSWIKVGGLSRALVAGTKYWLVALPLGPSSAKLHYDAAVASGGAGNVESTTTGLKAMTAESAWETFNQGPVGLQALGTFAGASAARVAHAKASAARVRRSAQRSLASLTAPAKPTARVAIEGAPASIIAGTSVQLAALGDATRTTWRTSAGEITARGLFTAPARVPRGGAVRLTASAGRGARDARTIAVLPVPTPQPAPAAQFAIRASAPPGAKAATAGLAAPQALIVGPRLILSTMPGRAGVVALSAQIGSRTLGSCSARTTARLGFTCRLSLRGVPANSLIGVRATLHTASGTLTNARAPAPLAAMSMPSTLAVRLLLKEGVSAAQLICSPGALAAPLPHAS